MTDVFYQPQGRNQAIPGHPEPTNLADVLERVLDRGIVIAGDIEVRLLDIELLTIKLRLLIASVDRAREMGINWWESDPSLSMGHSDKTPDENRALERRVEQIESRLGLTGADEEATVEQPRSLRPGDGRGGERRG